MREVSLLVFRTNFYKYTVSLRTCTDSLVGFGVNKASVLSSKLTGKDETVEKKKKQEEEKNQRNIKSNITLPAELLTQHR